MMSHILFLDIETVPLVSDFDQLEDHMKQLWQSKAAKIKPESDPAEAFERAGIYAEFGKIICISAGVIYTEADEERVRIISFTGDESDIILQFFEKITNFFKGKPKQFCGHNIKEFDIPYICRRALIHGIKLPTILEEMQNKKPWESPLIDTLQLWKFGDYKHYTSLDLLATCLGIQTPKDDIGGDDVANVYYRERNIDRIRQYCEKDVLTTIQVYRKLKQQDLISSTSVEFITNE